MNFKQFLFNKKVTKLKTLIGVREFEHSENWTKIFYSRCKKASICLLYIPEFCNMIY